MANLLRSLVTDIVELNHKGQTVALVIELAMTGVDEAIRAVVKARVMSLLESEDAVLHKVVVEVIYSTLVSCGVSLQDMALQFTNNYLHAGNFLHLLLPEADDVQTGTVQQRVVATVLRCCAEMDKPELQQFAKKRLHDYCQGDKSKEVGVMAAALLMGSEQLRVRELAQEVVRSRLKHDIKSVFEIYRIALGNMGCTTQHFVKLEQERHIARDFAIDEIIARIKAGEVKSANYLVDDLLCEVGVYQFVLAHFVQRCVAENNLQTIACAKKAINGLVQAKLSTNTIVVIDGADVAAIVSGCLASEHTEEQDFADAIITDWCNSDDANIRQLVANALILSFKSDSAMACYVAQTWLVDATSSNDVNKHEIIVNVLASLLSCTDSKIEDLVINCVQGLLQPANTNVIKVLKHAINNAWLQDNKLGSSNYSSKLVAEIIRLAEDRNIQAANLLIDVAGMVSKVDSSCDAYHLIPLGNNRSIVLMLISVVGVSIGRIAAPAFVAMQQYAGLSPRFKKQMVSAIYSGKTTKDEQMLQIGRELLQVFSTNINKLKAGYLLQQLIMSCVQSGDIDRQQVAAKLFKSCLQTRSERVDRLLIACVLIACSDCEDSSRLGAILLSKCEVDELYMAAKIVVCLEVNSKIMSKENVLIADVNDNIRLILAQLIMQLIKVDARTNIITVGMLFCHTKEVIGDVSKVLAKIDALLRGDIVNEQQGNSLSPGL